MSSTIYKGANSWQIYYAYVFAWVMIVFFIGVIFFAPPILRLPIGFVVVMAAIISTLSILFQHRGYYLEVREDGSLMMRRVSGFFRDEPEMNTLRLLYAGATALLSKDNIVEVALATEADIAYVKSWMPPIVRTPFNMGYSLRLLKSIGQKTFENGMGTFSLTFSSSLHHLVRIRVRSLTMRQTFTSFPIEGAVLFVSLLEHEKFLASYNPLLARAGIERTF